MNILMVTLAYAYDPAIAFGGPVKVVQNNARELVRRGNFGPFFSPGMITPFLSEGGGFDLIHINDFRAFTTVLAGLYAQVARIPYITQADASFKL